MYSMLIKTANNDSVIVNFFSRHSDEYGADVLADIFAQPPKVTRYV